MSGTGPQAGVITRSAHDHVCGESNDAEAVGALAMTGENICEQDGGEIVCSGSGVSPREVAGAQILVAEDPAATVRHLGDDQMCFSRILGASVGPVAGVWL